MSETLKDVSNTIQNLKLMGATVFEIVGVRPTPPPLVKGVGTKRLSKGRVKSGLKGDASKSVSKFLALNF